MTSDVTARQRFLTRDAFANIFEVLRDRGYDVVGPTIDQEAIVYDRINSIDDLPRGWTDEQSPGKYRLKRRDDDALFGYVGCGRCITWCPVGIDLTEEVAAIRGDTP